MQDIALSQQSSGQLTTEIQGTTGIWYSTWYANEGNYNWLSGSSIGSSSQMLADVNGDGLDDAIAYSKERGEWNVALSNGKTFNPYTKWITGHGIGSSSQMIADVNGDGKADAIVYFGQTGQWYAALSNGNGFNGYNMWRDGHGIGSNSQMATDVNGDGKADAIVYFGQTGQWYAALSNGNGFNGYNMWRDGHGIGSDSQIVADVNGDGKADAVVYFGKTGDWYTALSNGNGFDGYNQWVAGYGVNSTRQMIGDVNGDGKADAVAYYGQQGKGEWYVAQSSGDRFTNSYLWKTEHGQPSKFNNNIGSSWQGLGRIYSNKSSFAPVVYFSDGEEWKALPADKYSKPNILNTWEAWNIKYRPLTLGSYRAYDSNETAVIDEHLDLISKAKIDFILFDLTNNIDVDEEYIKQRAKSVVERISVWNSNPNNRKIKYAVAVGGMQFNNDPNTLEQEANTIWSQFVSNSDPNNYFNLNGKPLLVSYSSSFQKSNWQNANINKSATNLFNLEWAQGRVTDTGDNSQITPQSANTSQTSSNSYFGWGYPQGSLTSKDVMVVMPGWNNLLGEYVSRTYNGQEGDFYESKGWARVLEAKPNITVINSFNEYLEGTAVAPADTSLLPASEQWSSSNLYWDMTKSYNSKYKAST
ncbi:hemolysin-type calcium-binding protein [Calothrix sp. NIES-4071]|nr:hemolysin-type calcium-binding protein [Calothrix sp. NIES-4071]BAZ56053.1 hemolysin-type calcium-binding protein [Calothrix sp. NIES-4105]